MDNRYYFFHPLTFLKNKKGSIQKN